MDLRAHTGHLNITIYPSEASFSPFGFETVFEGPKYLDVRRYPIIKFLSTKVNFTNKDEVSSVEGKLIIRDQSTPIVFHRDYFICREIVQQKRVCYISFTAPFARTKVGLTYAVNLGVSRQAPIRVKLMATEQ
ncbi:MAG: YceI family protein [Neisseriaceae bacterium]